MVDMTSEAAGLTLKMKEALRNVDFRQDKKTGSATKKEEVVLLQYDGEGEGLRKPRKRCTVRMRIPKRQRPGSI